jgi:formylglycine-generating enzyme required for sulfatase activity
MIGKLSLLNCLSIMTLLFASGAFATPVAGDVDADSDVDAVDVQLVINGALGVKVYQPTDIDYSGGIGAVDVQLVINAALGIVIDMDGDGLCDGAEDNLGTNPNLADTDDDGVGDGQEMLDGTDPLSPPLVTPDLDVDTNSVNLSQASPSAIVTVSNAGGGTLSWTAESDDAAVTASPSSYTGNSKQVTASTSDFSESYMAQVTFTNNDDASDYEVVDVSVTGSGGTVTPGEMVSIPAGSFQMGNPFDGEGYDIERPVHTVTLSAYEIGKYEVTNQEYADILNWAYSQDYLEDSVGGEYAGGDEVYGYGQELLEVSGPAWIGRIVYSGGQFVVETRDSLSMADHPVIEVTWFGAAAYCNWLSESEGWEPCYATDTWAWDFSKNGYHLPTEAQWERAAAWDDDSSYHYRYGNGSDEADATNINYYNDNPLGLSGPPFTSPVGYYDGVNAGTVNSPSPVGCYDMTGNLWEWCNDWWRREYTGDSVTDPEGPAPDLYRVLRGGGWSLYGGDWRSAYRHPYPANAPTNYVGFRIAK